MSIGIAIGTFVAIIAGAAIAVAILEQVGHNRWRRKMIERYGPPAPPKYWWQLH